jgi:hypothetical protein
MMIEEKVTWDVPAVMCGNEIPRYLEPNRVGVFTRYFPTITCIRCRMEKISNLSFTRSCVL